MNVELTIQALLDTWPNLFKDRDDVLNQLFMTGTGYEWINGELCLSAEETPTEQYVANLQQHLVNGKAYQHNKLSLRSEILYALEKGYIPAPQPGSTQEAMLQKYISELPDDQYHKKPRAKRWGCNRDFANLPTHFSPHMFLLTAPKNIKPDWQAALEECRQKLTEDGYEVPPTTYYDQVPDHYTIYLWEKEKESSSTT